MIAFALFLLRAAPRGQLLPDSICDGAFYLLENLKGAFGFLDGFRALAQLEKS